MASDPSNTKHAHYSPPRKKTKQSKMVDARESLGEFESSIFDASDGHKLVDLIRRKKGLHVQTQKIFEDVPSHRPSLQIEIQRLDIENETLQPDDRLPLVPLATVNGEIPSRTEIVPKSPKRKSITKSITSPIIKMNSTTLGRRTLLKEFEKAFLNESRFNPEICSTPKTSDFSQQINHTNKNDTPKEHCISDKESPEENIICTPITISDEGSPAEQTNSMENRTLKENCTNEHMMRSLIKQNELLNALVQQKSQENEPDTNRVNSDKFVIKSPRRTFTVERDISNGKITLSPAKSRQNTDREPKRITGKLISTPNQRDLLKRLGLVIDKGSANEKGHESPQKSSRIPILSKPTTSTAPSCLTNHQESTTAAPSCLTNHQESTTAEFVERLQKNATPNCPVIVIPVNQTFNQAPTITKDMPHLLSPHLNEITSTISDNTLKAADYPSRQNEAHKEPTRLDSPVSNVISSTTISNGEQQTKLKVPEPLISNLRWDDILTDDASSSDKSISSNRKSALENERKKKISKQKKSKKKLSATNEKNKLSLSYKCLDLRVRVDSDEEREKNLPQKSQRQASQIDKQRRTFLKTNNLSLRSRQGASRIEERYDEEFEQNVQPKSRRGTFKIGDDDCEHDLPRRSRKEIVENEDNSPCRSRRKASKVNEKCIEEREHNFQHRSRRGASMVDDEDCEHNLHQQSRRRASEVAEQYNEDREQNLTHRNRRKESYVDEECCNERENNLQQRTRCNSKIDEQFDKDGKQPSRRVSSTIPDHFDEERESSLPRRGASETDEQCDSDREQNTSHRSRREEYISNLPQRSRRENSEIDKHRSKERENSLQLSSRRKTFNIVEQCDKENENNLPHRSPSRTSIVHNNKCNKEPQHKSPQRSGGESSENDEQQSKQHKNILPQSSREKISKNDKKRAEKHKQNLTQRSSKANLELEDDQSRKETENNLQLQSQQKTSNIVEQCNEELEQTLPLRSRLDISRIDEQLSVLRNTIHDNNEKEIYQQLPPPDAFRDIDSLCTNLNPLEKDLVDEDSSQRVVLSQDKFKRPNEVIKKKRGRKPKIIPENVKVYLEANKNVGKTVHLNVSKRKLYSKGNSDVESSDDSTFSRNSKHEKSRRSRKSAKSLTSKEKNTPKDSSMQESGFNSNTATDVDGYSSKAIDKEVNHKNSKQKRLSKSRPKNNNNNNNNNNTESTVDENISVRLSRSTTRTPNITKNSRQTKRRGPKFLHKDIEGNILYRRRNSSSSTDSGGKNTNISRSSSRSLSPNKISTNIERNSRSSNNKKSLNQSNKVSNRESIERNGEKYISPASSRSPSPPKTFLARKSNIQRNSSKILESKTKAAKHKDVESNLEEDLSDSTSKSLSPRKKMAASPLKNKKASKKTNALLTSVVNEDVDGKASASPSKSRSKKKISKKNNEKTSSFPCEDPTSTATTSLEHSEYGSLRRSKREKKTPTAYWACGNTEYTHVYDIYTMLTAGKKPYYPSYFTQPKPKKKDKTNLPSTDDNLVANTNTVDSSSKKNKIKTKKQSKEKNKKVDKPKSIENRELQSDSETELHRSKVSSELSQLPEPSTIEKPPDSSVPVVVDKTSSRVKSKSKQKSKQKGKDLLANANPSEQDTDSSDSKASNSNVKKRRLTTITENDQMVVLNNQRTTSVDVVDNNVRSSGTLMPPPKTSIVKKVNKTSKNNTFHTEHDESIADVSSVHVNNLFEQLKNSNINNSTINRSRHAMNSSEQVSLDNRSSNRKNNNSTNSVGNNTKNVTVRLQRLNLHKQVPHDKHFDSGFSSEDMNSISSKKDIVLDWLVNMLNKGKSNKERGLARFLQPNGFSIANADELTFEEIDGVDFAFYNSPGQKFGYLRFKPKTQKKLSCAKRYELNFVLLGGTIQMTVDKQTFPMRNGDLITIFIGTYYHMKNISDDPALVMVIRN